VYRLLYRLTGDHPEAEDVALETFLRLYRDPPTFSDGEHLSGWLYRVATNLGLNAIRSRNRRREYESQAGQQALEHESPADPAQEVERADERRQVRRALAGIKPRSAQILILRYSGFSYAEIAATVQVAPGSVGTLLARAEREFEECYHQSGGV
jgi:RNA polymerase sigma-70 factor (ECF subfamily)